jgi:hypothetical protein
MRCVFLIFWLLLLAGCRTFEIGFVQTPTPDRFTPIPAASATLPATATPAQLAATPLVFPTSTATLTPTATRIRRPTSTPIVPSPMPTTVPALPSIFNFSVEPLEVDPGDIVTLRWSVTNADAINIYQHVPDTLPSYNTVNLSTTGQLTQTIRAEERLWQSFELSAANAAGIITQTVTVSIRCPYTYFFSPLPVEDREEWSCPDGEPVTSAAAEQVFENGRMIWLQHDDLIYVLFDDGTYQTFEDTWVAGQPDSVPGLAPPAGRVAPVRGFGKVWSGDADVRSRLGWALIEERGFETQLQGGWLRCCSRLNAVNRPIYLRNVEGRIIRLWPGEVEPGLWKWVE